ncbi:type 1 glutamine amidotransferase [Haladaptatus sp. GCM10025707]|uniref:type 1 glutamine amidotransferase n=1 Tax=unclassified Haladaptatus TaxID=2622732 RepID=UPI0023E79988|nr:type 1 glutamine amidotransferase [Haladaptatus sp. QDMS2]
MVLVLENEVDPRYRYFGEALVSHLPGEVTVYDYPAQGGRPALDGVEAVVIGGSTAGVYEADDHPWMDDEKAFILDLVEARVPTLGVCFGHQLINEALGGRVEHRGTHAQLETVDLGDDPLFEGVNDVIPAVHGDFVVERGDGMEVLAAADYYENFATRHREAPVWTVQFHPEFTAELLNAVREDFGWTDTERSFDDVTAVKTLANFVSLAGDRQS